MVKTPRDRNDGTMVPGAAVVEAMPDPVLLLDAGRRVVMANGAAREAFGADLVGRDLPLALRHPRVIEAATAVLGGEPRARVALSLPVPVSRSYELHAVALEDGEGAAAALIFRDTTLVRESEKVRADFVANVSHELRSPLTSLTGFIETLRGRARDDPEAREKFLDIMEDEAHRMGRLIDDLLSLSRLEINEHIRPQGEVDLVGELRRVIAALSVRAAERGMTIELECPDDVRPIAGDGDQINQVFENLLDNAIKYGPEGTPIRVRVARVARMPDGTGPALSVAVQDRGEGIAAEHLPRLTERFYRVDKGRSRALGGTGLGLAIVKHVVNRHRGRLRIDSTPGEGSTFTVLLPTAEAET